MNTILVLAHQDAGQHARLDVAVDLARALGGHLGCIDGIAPMAVAGDVHGYFVAAEAMADECRRKTANELGVKARLASEEIAWNWIDGAGFLGDSLEAVSELADLVVVSIGQGGDEPPELRKLVTYLTTRRKAPVMAVPHHAIGLDLTGPALVAWDGSCRADEVLGDALPLLELSREIILLDIREDGDRAGQPAPGTAMQYLADHGLHATVERTRRRPNQTVRSAILDKAHERDAAYIVMGDYGRSPVNLDGAIRAMRAKCDLPLFLARG